MNIANLIDRARTKRGITSDMALAEHFGLNRQSVSKWRKGDAYPSQDHITELAEMAGENPIQWLVAIQAEREKGKAGKAWSLLAKQLGAAAALVLAVALPYDAKAATAPQAEQSSACTLCAIAITPTARVLSGPYRTPLHSCLTRRSSADSCS